MSYLVLPILLVTSFSGLITSVGKEKVLQSITSSCVVSVRKSFFFHLVLTKIGCVIVSWYSFGHPFN